MFYVITAEISYIYRKSHILLGPRLDAFLMLMLFCLQKTERKTVLFGPETWGVFILRMLLSQRRSHRAQKMSESGARWPLSTPTVSGSSSADAVQDRAHSCFILS